MVGITVGMTVFFIAYFHILRSPIFPVTVMPLTALDHLIPFDPWWLLPYVSLWVYVSLAPSILSDRTELVDFALASVALSVVGLTIFLLWPTVVPPSSASWEQYPWVAFLKNVDASGNACPSLHVAYAVLSGAWIDQTLRRRGAAKGWRIGNVIWAAMITYSTVATRQHVVLDVVGGAVLGAGVVAVQRWRPWRKISQTT